MRLTFQFVAYLPISVSRSFLCSNTPLTNRSAKVHVIGRFELLPELIEPDARFAVNVILKQDLQRSLPSLMARSHVSPFYS